MRTVAMIGSAALVLVLSSLAMGEGPAKKDEQNPGKIVREYLTKHHKGYQDPEEIKDETFAATLKDVKLFVARIEEGSGCEACKNTGRIVCVVGAKNEVSELKDEKDVVAFFKKSDVKSTEREKIRAIAYTTMLLIRLQHPKAHTDMILPKGE